MNNTEFMQFVKSVNVYVNTPKKFTINPERMDDVKCACDAAREIFSDMEITVDDDPLGTGALVLCIKGFDIVVRGTREINLFIKLICKADNFEIYADKGNIKFNIMFHNALLLV